MSGWLVAARHENLIMWLSVFTVGISLFSLGWNVYRDVILKPRFQVGLPIAEHPSDMSPQGTPVPRWFRNLVVGAAVIERGGIKRGTRLFTLAQLRGFGAS